MAGVKGRSGTNKGKDKPFVEALRMEILAAGTDHKALRRVARALLDKAGDGDVTAIREVADRLDGKPTQTSEVTVHSVSANELPDDELANIALGGGEGAAEEAVDPQKLN